MHFRRAGWVTTDQSATVNVLVSDDDANFVASVNVAVITCVPLSSSGVSIRAMPPARTGAVPSAVVVPWNVSVNLTVPVALGGDTCPLRTEQSLSGACVWRTMPNTPQTNCGSCSIGGFT